MVKAKKGDTQPPAKERDDDPEAVDDMPLGQRQKKDKKKTPQKKKSASSSASQSGTMTDTEGTESGTTVSTTTTGDTSTSATEPSQEFLEDGMLVTEATPAMDHTDAAPTSDQEEAAAVQAMADEESAILGEDERNSQPTNKEATPENMDEEHPDTNDATASGQNDATASGQQQRKEPATTRKLRPRKGLPYRTDKPVEKHVDDLAETLGKAAYFDDDEEGSKEYEETMSTVKVVLNEYDPDRPGTGVYLSNGEEEAENTPSGPSQAPKDGPQTDANASEQMDTTGKTEKGATSKPLEKQELSKSRSKNPVDLPSELFDEDERRALDNDPVTMDIKAEQERRINSRLRIDNKDKRPEGSKVPARNPKAPCTLQQIDGQYKVPLDDHNVDDIINMGFYGMPIRPPMVPRHRPMLQIIDELPHHEELIHNTKENEYWNREPIFQPRLPNPETDVDTSNVQKARPLYQEVMELKRGQTTAPAPKGQANRAQLQRERVGTYPSYAPQTTADKTRYRRRNGFILLKDVIADEKLRMLCRQPNKRKDMQMGGMMALIHPISAKSHDLLFSGGMKIPCNEFGGQRCKLDRTGTLIRLEMENVGLIASMDQTMLQRQVDLSTYVDKLFNDLEQPRFEVRVPDNRTWFDPDAFFGYEEKAQHDFMLPDNSFEVTTKGRISATALMSTFVPSAVQLCMEAPLPPYPQRVLPQTPIWDANDMECGAALSPPPLTRTQWSRVLIYATLPSPMVHGLADFKSYAAQLLTEPDHDQPDNAYKITQNLVIKYLGGGQSPYTQPLTSAVSRIMDGLARPLGTVLHHTIARTWTEAQAIVEHLKQEIDQYGFHIGSVQWTKLADWGNTKDELIICLREMSQCKSDTVIDMRLAMNELFLKTMGYVPYYANNMSWDITKTDWSQNIKAMTEPYPMSFTFTTLRGTCHTITLAALTATNSRADEVRMDALRTLKILNALKDDQTQTPTFIIWENLRDISTALSRWIALPMGADNISFQTLGTLILCSDSADGWEPLETVMYARRLPRTNDLLKVLILRDLNEELGRDLEKAERLTQTTRSWREARLSDGPLYAETTTDKPEIRWLDPLDVHLKDTLQTAQVKGVAIADAMLLIGHVVRDFYENAPTTPRLFKLLAPAVELMKETVLRGYWHMHTATTYGAVTQNIHQEETTYGMKPCHTAWIQQIAEIARNRDFNTEDRSIFHSFLHKGRQYMDEQTTKMVNQMPDYMTTTPEPTKNSLINVMAIARGEVHITLTAMLQMSIDTFPYADVPRKGLHCFPQAGHAISMMSHLFYLSLKARMTEMTLEPPLSMLSQEESRSWTVSPEAGEFRLAHQAITSLETDPLLFLAPRPSTAITLDTLGQHQCPNMEVPLLYTDRRVGDNQSFHIFMSINTEHEVITAEKVLLATATPHTEPVPMKETTLTAALITTVPFLLPMALMGETQQRLTLQDALGKNEEQTTPNITPQAKRFMEFAATHMTEAACQRDADALSAMYELKTYKHELYRQAYEGWYTALTQFGCSQRTYYNNWAAPGTPHEPYQFVKMYSPGEQIKRPQRDTEFPYKWDQTDDMHADLIEANRWTVLNLRAARALLEGTAAVSRNIREHTAAYAVHTLKLPNEELIGLRYESLTRRMKAAAEYTLNLVNASHTSVDGSKEEWRFNIYDARLTRINQNHTYVTTSEEDNRTYTTTPYLALPRLVGRGHDHLEDNPVKLRNPYMDQLPFIEKGRPFVSVYQQIKPYATRTSNNGRANKEAALGPAIAATDLYLREHALYNTAEVMSRTIAQTSLPVQYLLSDESKHMLRAKLDTNVKRIREALHDAQGALVSPMDMAAAFIITHPNQLVAPFNSTTHEAIVTQHNLMQLGLGQPVADPRPSRTQARAIFDSVMSTGTTKTAQLHDVEAAELVTRADDLIPQANHLHSRNIPRKCHTMQTEVNYAAMGLPKMNRTEKLEHVIKMIKRSIVAGPNSEFDPFNPAADHTPNQFVVTPEKCKRTKEYQNNNYPMGGPISTEDCTILYSTRLMSASDKHVFKEKFIDNYNVYDKTGTVGQYDSFDPNTWVCPPTNLSPEGILHLFLSDCQKLQLHRRGACIYCFQPRHEVEWDQDSDQDQSHFQCQNKCALGPHYKDFYTDKARGEISILPVDPETEPYGLTRTTQLIPMWLLDPTLPTQLGPNEYQLTEYLAMLPDEETQFLGRITNDPPPPEELEDLRVYMTDRLDKLTELPRTKLNVADPPYTSMCPNKALTDMRNNQTRYINPTALDKRPKLQAFREGDTHQRDLNNKALRVLKTADSLRLAIPLVSKEDRSFEKGNALRRPPEYREHKTKMTALWNKQQAAQQKAGANGDNQPTPPTLPTQENMPYMDTKPINTRPPAGYLDQPCIVPRYLWNVDAPPTLYAQDGVDEWQWNKQWTEYREYISPARHAEYVKRQGHFGNRITICRTCGLAAHQAGNCPYRALIGMWAPRGYTLYPGLVFQHDVGWWIQTRGGMAVPVKGPIYRRQSNYTTLAAESNTPGQPQTFECMTTIQAVQKTLDKLAKGPTETPASSRRSIQPMTESQYRAIFTRMSTAPPEFTIDLKFPHNPPKLAKPNRPTGGYPMSNAKPMKRRHPIPLITPAKRACVETKPMHKNMHEVSTKPYFKDALDFQADGYFTAGEQKDLEEMKKDDRENFIYVRIMTILSKSETARRERFEVDSIMATAIHFKTNPDTLTSGIKQFIDYCRLYETNQESSTSQDRGKRRAPRGGQSLTRHSILSLQHQQDRRNRGPPRSHSKRRTPSPPQQPSTSGTATAMPPRHAPANQGQGRHQSRSTMPRRTYPNKGRSNSKTSKSSNRSRSTRRSRSNSQSRSDSQPRSDEQTSDQDTAASKKRTDDKTTAKTKEPATQPQTGGKSKPTLPAKDPETAKPTTPARNQKMAKETDPLPMDPPAAPVTKSKPTPLERDQERKAREEQARLARNAKMKAAANQALQNAGNRDSGDDSDELFTPTTGRKH